MKYYGFVQRWITRRFAMRVRWSISRAVLLLLGVGIYCLTVNWLLISAYLPWGAISPRSGIERIERGPLCFEIGNGLQKTGDTQHVMDLRRGVA